MSLTVKQEKFAQKYIETGNASEAYRQSYNVAKDTAPETTWNDAYKLLKSPDVSARIEKLLEMHTKKHFVTVDTLTNEYEDIRAAAFIEKQFSPAIAAVAGKAKLHGLAADKQEIKAAIEIKDTTPIESAKRVAFLLAQAASQMTKEQ